METKLFFINALSNLHVGSGEINYGLVDNLIQRDPVSGLPTINSSSLKGALREHFSNLTDTKVDVKTIFGSDPKETKSRQQGSVRFFDADLVSIPIRATGATFSFAHATSSATLKRIALRNQQMNVDDSHVFLSIDKLPTTQGSSTVSVKLEDLINGVPVYTTNQFAPIVGEHLAIVSENQLNQLCNNEHLPIISRNCLDNGQSTNLFYEQVLPRYSRLVTIVMGEGEKFEAFCKALNNQIIQIGAHATIGYGFCQFSIFPLTNNTLQK